MTNEIQQQPSRNDPWNDLDRIFDDLRHWVFDTFGTPLWAPALVPGEGAAAPSLFRAARTDVSDTGTAFQIVAEIPGIPKENLDIRVRGSSVEIRGEASPETKHRDHASYVHRERRYAGFYRSFELPEPVVAGDAKATVENGLLELELPKQHPSPSNAEVKVAVQ
jgi:HSP20 family protein